MKDFVYYIILATVGIFSTGALLAFYWAAKHGQFQNLKKGANSIFDRDEAVGVVTDHFPVGCKKTN